MIVNAIRALTSSGGGVECRDHDYMKEESVRKTLFALLFLAAALGALPGPAPAWYYCVEITDAYSCHGVCVYVDDETGRVTGRLYYQC